MNMKKFIAGAIACIGMTVTLSASANLQGEIDSWFDSSGYSNSTSAGVYKSQIGGYYSGGSLSMRVPTRTVGGFMSYQEPKFSSGCGGLDLDMGGFNLVSKDEIVQQLRAIGQNAKSLAFSMAIKYISSLLGSTMDTIKGFANELNFNQMSSCEAAQNMLGAFGLEEEKFNNAGKEHCIKMTMSVTGATRDEALTKCTRGAGGRLPAGDPNPFNFLKGNLAWYSMMQVPWLRTDLDTAELLMGITGTFIVITERTGTNEETFDPLYFPPAVTKENCAGDDCTDLTLEALLDYMVFGTTSGGFAGPIELIKCAPGTKTADPTGCDVLADSGQPQPIDAALVGNGIKQKLVTRIKGIYDKVYDPNATLSADEKALIETVAAPIYRYILASASAFRTTEPEKDKFLNMYIDAMAKDIVATNLAKVMEELKKNSTQESLNVLGDSSKEGYMGSVDAVAKALKGVRNKQLDTMGYVIDLQHEGQKYERVIIGRLSPGTLSSALFK